ncbi:protein SHI RELATED SEQUENCE 1-like [Canna indica]|uniref:Protein SHI RELATED SEQUENCE 1-like n=1 Tax=Canna indica TaxID=4628 RepID=A0AAQ3L6Y3_9LILI|nr:protein SHI RELATED SEQUENCE 1-like [Canna indica]
MAEFSLGGGGSRQGGGEEGIPPESLFLYGSGSGGAGGSRTEEITYGRGFELWQQHQQQIHRQQQHLYMSSSTAGLLSFSDEPLQAGSAIGRAMSSRSGGSGGGSMSCQDCGNQAKKDCSHMRCRTCCKSRGFQCPTHVRSTWVPAAKRRERQQQLAAAAAAAAQQQHSHRLRIGGSPGGGGGGNSAGEPSKRPREIVTRLSTAITTTSSGGGGGEMSFPAEVSSPAVFRCLRVSSLDDADDEFAYQTAVSIGGHVFKGILYDHGPDVVQGESPSSTAGAAAITSAHPGAPTLAAPTTAAASAGLLDPSALYPTPLGAFMAGTQFFPHHPRP